MKTLALETSAKSVSVAVTENGTLLAPAYQDRGLTHSVTLMPLLDGMLKTAGLTLDDMDTVSYTHLDVYKRQGQELTLLQLFSANGTIHGVTSTVGAVSNVKRPSLPARNSSSRMRAMRSVSTLSLIHI